MPDVTIDDTLRETYANLRGSFESDFTPAASEDDGLGDGETVNEEVVEPGQDGSHGAEGAEASTDGEEAAEGESGEQTEQPKTFRPGWKKAALAVLDKLTPEDRALVVAEEERRANDFHKGLEQYKERATAAQEWERISQPFMATLTSLGVTPQFAAQELFKADHLLRYSPMPQKVQSLIKIAGDYGVDINTLAQGIQQIAGEQVWQQQNPVDPRLQQLQAQVGQLQQHITNTQQQAVAQEHSAIDSEIAAFAADPDHEHFGILQPAMAVLLQNGMAKTLDDAYEMAMRQNPQTYQIWLAQQQQEWDAQRKAKVLKAKQAGANNVRPNGRASAAQASTANETMDQTLARIAREVGLTN